MNDCVCMKCKERHVGCHSECERYKEWKKNDLDARRALRRDTLALEARWGYGKRFQS